MTIDLVRRFVDNVRRNGKQVDITFLGSGAEKELRVYYNKSLVYCTRTMFQASNDLVSRQLDVMLENFLVTAATAGMQQMEDSFSKIEYLATQPRVHYHADTDEYYRLPI